MSKQSELMEQQRKEFRRSQYFQNLDRCSAVVDVILNGADEQPPEIGYVLVTFSFNSAITGDVIPIINTNSDKRIVESVFKQVIELCKGDNDKTAA